MRRDANGNGEQAMNWTRNIIRLTLLVLALALPATAGADTICVGSSSLLCNSVKPGTAAGLHDALSDASTHSGADTVKIAAGTYVGHFSYVKDEDVTIVGAGPDATILRSDAFNGALEVTGHSPATTVVSDLGVEMGDIDGLEVSGIYLSKAGAENVKATNPGGSFGRGVRLADGGQFRHGEISVGNAFGVGTITPDGPRSVSDTSIDASLGVEIGSGSIAIDRVRMNVDHTGVSSAATTTISNSLIRVGGTGVNFGLYQFNGGSTTANHVTIVGATGADYGVAAIANGASSSYIAMANSIVAGGWYTSLSREAVGSGPANLIVGHSALAAPVTSSVDSSKGPGSFTDTGGNTNADPHFVDSTVTLASPQVDYRLTGASALIDAGDPAGPGSTDLNGAPRLVDGDGASGAQRDMGAFEYQRQAPIPVIAAPAAGTFPAGTSIGFDAAGSSDPDGDPITYAWDFGDGAQGSGPSTSHAYAAGGTPATTLAVTDAAGLTATATRQLTITAPTVGGDAGGGGATTPPPGDGTPAQPAGGTPRDTVAPRIIRPTLARTRFRASGRRPGTTLRFRLSERARVIVTIERRGSNGRYRKVGALAGVRLGAGARTLRLSGKLGRATLAPGRYRTVLVAIDAAGNRSKTARLAFRVVR
jgi:hypothetical protein